MTARAFEIWWKVIPANVAATAANLLIIISIPIGLWRGLEPWQFVTGMLSIDAAAWISAYVYFSRHPIMD